jgi:2-polyprenyl-6-methoxyphenol hydroxylase-like FAD-dependent oxidoreductase
MLRRTETVLEYPMVDRDPIDRWTFGRVTLLGDAAHPMLPRGSNGAMQAVLDGRALADALAAEPVPAALARYERERLERVNRIVLTNRSTPPDFLIETVQQRTDDQPFDRLEDVVEDGELAGLMEKYKRLTGYDAASLSALEET